MKMLLAFALVLGAGISHAGGLGTIEGSVVASSGSIAGARVEVACGGIRRSVTVDGAGNFTVSGLPEGTCTVTIRRSGFADSVHAVTVTGGSIASVLVNLHPPVVHAPEPMAARGVEQPTPSPPAAKAPARQKQDKPKAERKPDAQAKPVLPKPVIVRLDGKQRVHRRIGLKTPPDVGVAVADGGFAPVRVFPVPQYTERHEGPRTDFRETIYWNPSVQTDAAGHAEVTFFVSDAVTAFRATAEGFSATGTPGSGQLAIQTKLPFTLDAKLPVEVTAGDTIRLPVTLANETDEPIDATLDARFGTAFKLAGAPATGAIRLAPGEKKTVFFPLHVIATSGTADVELRARADGLADEVKKTIRVVPKGFPFELSASGTAKRGQVSRHELDLSAALQGTIEARVTMYASPVASMTQGMEGMIREPYGCFEQTSATNYPNIMILSYLQTHDVAEPALVDKTHGMLDRGYKLLTGFETKQRGYEWFGHAPGHEALTAYGLMEFADMAKVYAVDAKMVQRTADWLMSRRDGKGGFQRAKAALDTFGRAGDATTNAYIMWALAEANRTGGMGVELAAQQRLAESSTDPYVLALATNTLLLAKRDGTGARRLAAMQAKDGSFPGAKESITKSGGDSLVIETTALAALALLKSPDHATQARAAVDWLNKQRGGHGQWSNTQATVLGLKALTAYAEVQRKMQSGGAATLIVNGKRMQTIEFEAGRKEPLVWDDLTSQLGSGKNVIEIELASDSTLPYSIAIDYRSARPQSSPNAKLAVTSTLAKTQAKMGEGVALRVHVENTTTEGIPMTLARVGIPGGMVFQSWQLKELRDKGLVDFYETRPREVILYWRQLAPSAKHDLDLALLATVPGTYEAPASSAYLYYTAEDKAWSPPVKVAIDR